MYLIHMYVFKWAMYLFKTGMYVFKKDMYWFNTHIYVNQDLLTDWLLTDYKINWLQNWLTDSSDWL